MTANCVQISYEVLRSYLDVEGGFLLNEDVVGHSFPPYTEPGSSLLQPPVEHREVLAALAESRRTGHVANRVIQDQKDLVLVAVLASPTSELSAWSLRRIFNFSDSSELNKRLLLVAAMFVSLIAIGTVLRLSFSLQRGFEVIQTGLVRLRTDPKYRLPDQDHELRTIVQAVNTMAESRQKLEADLRREDRLRVMGRVVAGIAHEIRNPLNSIRLTIRVLARRLKGQPSAEEPINLITNEIDRLDSLLKSLLVFRADEPEKERRQPLKPLLERTLALVKPHAEDNGVTFRVTAPSECEALVDGDHLQQALMNLLLNAIDASGNSGEVDVSMRTRRWLCGNRRRRQRARSHARATGKNLRSLLYHENGWHRSRAGCDKSIAGEDGRENRVAKRVPRGPLPCSAAGGKRSMKARVLIVEDEKTACQALSLLLSDEGYKVLKAETGEAGLRVALQEEPDLILLDIRLPDVDGLTVLQRVRAAYCDAAVIIMTANTTSSNAIRATQYGAFDYVSKPINDEHLILLIQRALEYRKLEKEVRSLRQVPGQAPSIPGMVGHSLAMQEVYKMIGRVANSDATVLIIGESGTGKELVANAIHEFSARAQGPLVKVNCAAIPEDLLEAELFGHEKGAFTNALSRRVGRFEQAHGGTLFLDEVAELSPSLQAKLLRATQERTVERLGSNSPHLG